MDYNFQVDSPALRIPVEVYKAIKKCPNCGSVFIDETKCDSCGRSMSFHPVGVAFGPKSYYGIKERYIEKMPHLLRLFPQFENIKSSAARSYVRQLSKRFSDLLAAFHATDLIKAEERKLFFAESLELIDELLLYGVEPITIQNFLEDSEESLIGQELLFYLDMARKDVMAQPHWWNLFLDYRLWDVLRVDFFLKAILITATVSTMAVVVKDLINLQFGR